MGKLGTSNFLKLHLLCLSLVLTSFLSNAQGFCAPLNSFNKEKYAGLDSIYIPAIDHLHPENQAFHSAEEKFRYGGEVVFSDTKKNNAR